MEKKRNAIKQTASGSIHAYFLASSSPHGLTSKKFLPHSPVVPWTVPEPKMVI